MRHGVLGLVLSRLQQEPSGSLLPAPVRSELEAQLNTQRRRAALWVLERDRLLAALRREGIEPIVLKGAALCTTAYEEPVRREFGDIDLLFAPEEIEAATGSIVGCGYRDVSPHARQAYRDHHFHYRLVHPQGFIVEIHWGLVRPGGRYRLSAEAFRAGSQVVRDREGSELRMPAGEDQLLHISGQNMEDYFSRLGRIVDADRVAGAGSGVDWDRMVRDARDGGLSLALWLTLRLAVRLLATPADPHALRELAPSRVTALHIDLLAPERSLLRKRFSDRWTMGTLLSYWLLPSAESRREMARELATGATDPLTWLWHGGDPSVGRRPGMIARLVAMAKLAGWQLGLYLSAPLRLGRWWPGNDPEAEDALARSRT